MARQKTVRNIKLSPPSEDFGDGRKTVTAGGDAERLVAASTVCRRVVITAELDNTGIIVVGSSTVVAVLANRRGIPLSAGDSFEFEISDLYNVYLDATVNGDGVTYLYFK